MPELGGSPGQLSEAAPRARVPGCADPGASHLKAYGWAASRTSHLDTWVASQASQPASQRAKTASQRDEEMIRNIMDNKRKPAS